MTERWDAIVVGAGHNGLVCAALLAKAGLRVLVLEAAQQVGGAAVTRSFADGYLVSPGAHLLYQLQPEIRRELGLKLQFAGDDLETIVLAGDGRKLRLRGPDATGVGAADAARYHRFHKRMARFADVLRRRLVNPPPRLGTRDWKDLAALAHAAFDIRRLGRDGMRDFLRIVGMNMHDEVSERFDSPLLRGAVSFDAVLGTHLGPRSPGTIMTYLYRLAGNHGRLAVPKGGMGSVTAMLAQAARAAGATIRTAMPVRRIIVDNGRVTGVETADGEQHLSYTVVSNADPRRTIMRLVGARHFETAFARRVQHFRSRGNAAKLHLALDGLPAFAGFEPRDFGQRVVIAGDEHEVERAFNPAKYGEFSARPVIEMTFPSCNDETLAPAGRHVMSAVVQYVPYAVRGGWTAAAREACLDTVLATIERHAPDIRERIVASELLTPADIEKEFHITGGHWHHGELTLDQFLFTRPVCGAAQYAMPLDGLFLCGAGTHPGGGVSGAAGRNAARSILGREKAK